MEEGKICSVNHLSNMVLSLASTVDACREEAAETCFFNVLLKWGNTWLWDDLTVEGDENWLEQSILMVRLLPSQMGLIRKNSTQTSPPPDSFWNANKIKGGFMAP